MIVIDVGNTNIVIGIYIKKKLNKLFRINTEKNKKKFETKFKTFLNSNKTFFLKSTNKICVLSSVVPSLNFCIKKIFEKKAFKFYTIDTKNLPTNIKINYKLNQIGSDRVANYIAIYNKKIINSIIVDFGTATTFDVIKNNEYYGGLIFPGITLSMNSLINNTELLKKSKITKVKQIVKQDTISSIKSGFYFGYLHAINGILKQIIAENKFRPKIYLTGGLGEIFRDKIDFKPIYIKNLTLEGIKLIGEHLHNE
tara:strand:- start:144 stop:905 length:762 start_codon:yes stop_codon:yes gene_type:complete